MRYLTRTPEGDLDYTACKSLIKNITEFIKKHSDIVVLGLSGGADSTLVACLCTQALGKDNVYGISMPCSEIDYKSFNQRSAKIADRLGINHYIRCVSGVLESFEDEIGEMTKLNNGNLRARIRMAFLYSMAGDLSESNKCKNVRVIGTGNLNEGYIGYCTKHGDAATDISPIGDLYKQEVYDLLDYFVSQKRIDEEHIDRTPSAGLWEGQTDEGELGYTYNQMAPAIELLRKNGDQIPQTIEEVVSESVKFVRDRHHANRHKHMAPPVFEARPVPEKLWFQATTGTLTHICPSSYQLKATQ